MRLPTCRRQDEARWGGSVKAKPKGAKYRNLAARALIGAAERGLTHAEGRTADD